MSRVSRSQRITFERSHQFTLADYITDLTWSVDGTLLAATSAAGEVTVWDWDAVIASSAVQPSHQFSNQFSNQSSAQVSTHTASQVLQGAMPNRAISCLGISATNLLAAAGQAGTVTVWQAQETDTSPRPMQALITLGDGNHWIDQLAWHPFRNYLAFSMGHRVQIWDIPANQHLADISFEASSVLGMMWHPSGYGLAVSGHGGVHVWNSTTWKQESYRLQVPGASISLAWSPDGDYLASGNLDRTLSVLRWKNPPPWLMQGFPGKVRSVSWVPLAVSPTPQLVAACADGITIWVQEPSGKNWRSSVLQGHEGTVQAIAHHPTQPILASGARDGQVCLWHQSKTLGQRLKVRSPGISSLAWHPTRQHLAVGGIDGQLEIWSPSQRGQGFQ